MGLSGVLLDNVKRRFPDCGTLVEERCICNLLDPSLKIVHLIAAKKFTTTKERVKARWSHLPEMQGVGGGTSQQPLSPTSKLLKETGALVEEESTDGRKLVAELLDSKASRGSPRLWTCSYGGRSTRPASRYWPAS